MGDYQGLATYRNCVTRCEAHWQEFLAQRRSMFAQAEQFGRNPEKVAENVLACLFTSVLDWRTEDLNWQVGYADLVVTRNAMKYLLVEAKHPGSFSRTGKALEHAVSQAWTYADRQCVKRIAVSDGTLLHVDDIENGGLRPRVRVWLNASHPPGDALWWISVNGIERDCERRPDAGFPPGETQETTVAPMAIPADPTLRHSKYKIPARCFAYVGDASHPSTWKLPYLLEDGSPDPHRLPKAIQALITNYRGVKVGGIPAAAIPDVCRRLTQAATLAGKMPAPGVPGAPVYRRLGDLLAQLQASGK
ncbi:MAG: hypothetical protein ACYCQK_00955 [Acidiferrobacteraceae bacterium]